MKKTFSRALEHKLYFSFLFSIFLLTSCELPIEDGSALSSVFDQNEHLVLVSGNNQNATVQTQLSTPLRVQAIDADGRGMPGVSLSSFISGGGSITPSTLVTDSNGMVSILWKMGSSVGTNGLSISAGQLNGSPNQLSFFATAKAGAVKANTSSVSFNSAVIGGASYTPPPGSFPADGSSTAVIAVIPRDALSNPVAGVVVSLSSNRPTLDTFASSPIAITDASGLATFSIRSQTAGTSIYTAYDITDSLSLGTASVVYSPAASMVILSAAPATVSSRVQSSLVVTLRDSSNNLASNFIGPVSLSSSDTLFEPTVCQFTAADNGSKTCPFTLISGGYQSLTLGSSSLTSATVLIYVNAGVPTAPNSTISGTGPVDADGISLSTITILLKDVNGNVVSGQTPTFSASGSGNTYGACSVSNLVGVSNCVLSSSQVGTKTLSIVTPFAKTGGTVMFKAPTITAKIPYDVTTDAEYTFDPTKIALNDGVCRLASPNQIDQSNALVGFGGGIATGLVWDSALSALKLATPENPELDPSWTPQWAHLVHYWKLDGVNAASLTNNAIIPSSLATAPNDTGLATISGSNVVYAGGKVNQGISFDGSASNIAFQAEPLLSWAPTQFTVSWWLFPNNCLSHNQSIGSGNEHPFYFVIDVNCSVHVGVNSSTRIVPADVGNNIITPLTWQHLVFTYNAGVGVFYKNGVLIKSKSGMAPSTAWGGFKINPNVHNSNMNGMVDEVAIWDTPLTGSEIATLYSRQNRVMPYSGTLTSRVFDANSSASWTSFAWKTTHPFYKELPNGGSANNETTSEYPTVSTSLLTGIVGLWHLNETGPGTAPGGKDFADSSGNSNHGTKVSIANADFQQPGKFSSAVAFNGTSHIDAGTAIPLNNQSFSLSAWVRRNTIGREDYFFGMGTGTGTRQNLHFGFRSTNKFTFAFFADDADTLQSYGNNIWYHIVGTFDKTTNARFVYIDGVKAPLTNYQSGGPFVGTGSFFIGKTSNAPFLGMMDEVGVWSRVLSPAEVASLYQRGASRIKFQVSTCSQANCSDAAWKGPDGTNGTFFSELYNLTSGNVNSIAPSLAFTSTQNRYFQYKANFESDDANPSNVPMLQKVVIGPDHYDTSSPAIINNNPILFSSVSSFSKTLGPQGCSQTPKFQLSLNKSAWFYWTGSAWASSDGTYNQSNTDTEIHANIASFNTQVGTGALYVKTLLKSTGTTPCEVDNITTKVIQ